MQEPPRGVYKCDGRRHAVLAMRRAGFFRISFWWNSTWSWGCLGAPPSRFVCKAETGVVMPAKRIVLYIKTRKW